MDRSAVWAAALLLLLATGSTSATSERELLAHKPSGGALHGVAVVGALNYFITNGNGSWVYSYYSGGTTLAPGTGNAAGQGAAASYASLNPVYQNALSAEGSDSCADQLSSSVFGLSAAATYAATVTSGTNFYNGPSAGLSASYVGGINALQFPTHALGIAVGALGLTAGTTTCVIPNVIQTTDAGASWQRITTMPAMAWGNYIPSLASHYSAAQQVMSNPVTANAGNANPLIVTSSNVPLYPLTSPGDFVDVFMASSTLGWAVGGNMLALVDDANYAGTAVSGQPTATATFYPDVPVGYILMTTNGGTVWRNIPLLYQPSVLAAALAAGAKSTLAALYSQAVPGFLFGVGSDASGKHVYAVGSPVTQSKYSGTTLTWSSAGTPTILYSGNGGISWALQSAPLAMGGGPTVSVSLLSVAVRKGTTAWAVGGNLGSCYYGQSLANGGCNNVAVSTALSGNAATVTRGAYGTILGTTNGGFTWTQMTYPGSATPANVPVFTCIAINSPGGGGKNVGSIWVGGYTLVSAYYPFAANTTTNGLGYTVLVSTDGVNFKPPTALGITFPAFFLQSGPTIASWSTATSQIFPYDVHGIVWDNNRVGYMHGNGFIMSTHDGGNTWVNETPNAIISGSGAGGSIMQYLVQAMARVPTVY